jgi:hypothetical protein
MNIADLVSDPNNVRKHDTKNIEAIKGSLIKFGQQKPIVATKDGIVLAGNGTLQAAKEIGWDKISVYVTDLEGFNASAFAIADNRTSELASWDDGLAESLNSLQAPVHVKSVRTKHFLEDQKTYQNISYDQMMIIEDQLNQRTKELQEEMKSGQLSIDKQSLLKNLEEQRAEILAFVTSQGGEYMRYGTERLFKEVENVAKNVKINGNDFSDEESMRSIETLQAQVLSAALHDTVEATRDGVEKGLERLKKQWGDQFTARMGILVNNLESSAGDGARNFAGLFKVHADNGEEDYRAVENE